MIPSPSSNADESGWSKLSVMERRMGASEGWDPCHHDREAGPGRMCDRAPGKRPAEGAFGGVAPSVRARQAEHVLGQIRQDQVRRDRRHLVETRFAELALDVVFLGEAVAAMGLEARIRGLERGVG